MVLNYVFFLFRTIIFCYTESYVEEEKCHNERSAISTSEQFKTKGRTDVGFNSGVT